jgi:methyl-accepting chemotaxis protein
MLEIINARLSIPTRLTLIGALFFAPIAFLTFIFIQQSLGDIGFAEKEIAGTRYLTEVWPVFMKTATTGDLAAADFPDRAKYDALFGTADASAAFAGAKDLTAKLEAGKTLIGAVADGSNLTLDPDLDSFYAMDAVTVRIPGIAAAAVALGQAAAEAPAPSRIVDVAFAMAHLRSSSEDANGSLSSAIKNNAAGLTGKALSALTDALKTSSDALTDRGAAILQGKEVGDLPESQSDLLAKVAKIWTPANTELARLLQVRVDNFYRRMYISLGFSSLFLLAAVALSFVIASGLSTRIHALISVMDRLVANDHEVKIPFHDDVNETGQISKSLEVFRRHAIDKVVLEAEAREERERGQAARQRAAEEAIQAERKRVTSSFGIALAKLASKQLHYRLTDEVPEAYEKLRADFNDALAEMESALRNVRNSALTISNGAQEISAASQDLARRTEHQAASLEESAASMRELTSVINRTAEFSLKTKDVIAVAKANSGKSQEVVEKTITAVSGIMDSSQQIGAIVGVIDEIAFQTNLLALNAGVEAARAGDAGRGFAVVATEVRALAQRSASAAKEINALINRASAEVTNGVELVAATGEAFEHVKDQISGIDSGIADIASNTIDQSTTLKQVNTSLGEIDQITQQNAAMAEQATAACQSLALESERLANMVKEFQISLENGDSDQENAPDAPSRSLAA